jgi:hypothetical protein
MSGIHNILQFTHSKVHTISSSQVQLGGLGCPNVDTAVLCLSSDLGLPLTLLCLSCVSPTRILMVQQAENTTGEL